MNDTNGTPTNTTSSPSHESVRSKGIVTGLLIGLVTIVIVIIVTTIQTGEVSPALVIGAAAITASLGVQYNKSRKN